jgi:hypothetical protein
MPENKDTTEFNDPIDDLLTALDPIKPTGEIEIKNTTSISSEHQKSK